MGKKMKFAYCKNCEKEVFKAKRKPIDSMYYNVWIVSIISSLGFALVPFIIYRYGILRKNLCPICQSELEFYKTREEIPEPKAQIARILQVIEQEKREKEETMNCPYCQEEINIREEICPKCGSILKPEN
ncbi:MAG: hypothetical protein ACFFEY_04945 [Candidatus Thorarchaeota archaeon]